MTQRHRLSVAPGSRLGSYEIVDVLGAGGMGVVYRARDTRLRRDVAIKVLADIDVSGPEAEAQLLREARAAAALNHPNICTIHEVGALDGVPFIVMELVAGEALDAILRGGPLPIDRACRLGRQVADAIEHAHASGIVHGDLKPANVIVAADGRAKILDFGIARRAAPSDTHGAVTQTVEAASSFAGTLVYMAPEVLQGQAPDVRSDVWALGVFLYETVAGRPPFEGATAAELSASILRDAPRPLMGDIPPGLLRIIQRCLAKAPGERFSRAGDVATALEIIDAERVPGTAPHTSRHRAFWAGAALAAAVGIAGLTTLVRTGRFVLPRAAPAARSAPAQLTHFATSVRDPVISPDGRLLAFVVQEPGRNTTQVYVEALPDGRPVQLTHGPEAKAFPAFSSDATRIAYTVTGGEWKWDTWIVEVAGGTPQLMLRNANALRWTRDGRVLFSEFKQGSQLAIAIAGEGRTDERDVYIPPVNGMAHYSDVSPDGTQVFVGEMIENRTRCFVTPLSGGAERVVQAGAMPCMMLGRWSPDGRIVYFVAGSPGNYQVWRQPAAGGDAEQVTSGPGVLVRGLAPAGFALYPDARAMVYATGEAQESLWVRRPDGIETQLTFEGDARAPSVSSDGRRLFYIAAPRFRLGAIRMRGIDAEEDRPLAAGQVASEVWASPDGDRFVFTRPDANGRFHLWTGMTDNRAAPRQLTAGEQSESSAVFAASGGTLYYASAGADGATLWSLNLDTGDRRRISESAPQLAPVSVSPDGAWLSVQRTDVSPQETWLYPTSAGSKPRRLYTSWRFEWAPGNRSFLFSSPGMISTAWAIPNPRGAMLPPLGDGPIPEDLQRIGGRKILDKDFFVEPVALPVPFSIVYSKVEARSNLFQMPLGR